MDTFHEVFHEVATYLFLVVHLACLVVIAIRLRLSVAGILGILSFAISMAASAFWFVFNKLDLDLELELETYQLLTASTRALHFLGALLLLGCFLTIAVAGRRPDAFRPPPRSEPWEESTP